MAGGSIVRIDTSELESVTRQLASATNKDVATAINKKMGWLLRRWMWITPKSDYNQMARSLGMKQKLYASGQKTTKTGKTIKFKGGWKVKGVGKGNLKTDSGSVAMLVAMISKSKHGSPYKGKTRSAGRQAMIAAVKKRFSARAKAVAYLKSGIATALKPFLKFASGSSAFPPDTKAKQVGRAKGFGTVATPGQRVLAVAVSKTTTKRQKDKALLKYSLPALKQAYAEELADTKAYLNKTLYETARKLGISARP